MMSIDTPCPRCGSTMLCRCARLLPEELPSVAQENKPPREKMTTPNNNIIRQMRIKAGFSQKELAGRANISQTRISVLEHQNGNWATDTVDRIAKACGLYVAYFPPGRWEILPAGFKTPEEKL